jgi:hypothetical protein
MKDILSQQINGVLQNAIFNQVRSIGVNIPSPILQRVVSQVAERASILVSTNVVSTTNFNLTDIPKNLLGVKNPVSMTTGNLGSTGISNNLGNLLQTQLSSQLTNQIVVLLQTELANILPSNLLGIINLNGLTATLIQGLTPTINSTINQTLNTVSTNLFKPKTPSTEVPSDPAQYSNFQASKALDAARNFNPFEGENKEKLEANNKGFRDPNANYPKTEYKNEPETNKLARGDIKGTIVQEKNDDRMIGAKLPGGSSWEQPQSPYKGEYPYNKVTQTESGHVIEVDDTPGAERVHVYHKSGTFVEIDANGSIVKRAKGSSYEIVDRNGKIAISGKADISVNGACNIFVGNDANIEVDGDTNILCHNDITAMAGGKLNLSAVEDVNISGGNVRLQAFNNFDITSNVNLNLHTDKTIHMHSNTEIKVQAEDYFNKLSGSMFNQAAGEFHFKSGGTFNADASEVYINSGNSEESQDSKIAEVSQIGLLTGKYGVNGRKDILLIDIDDPVALTIADKDSTALDEPGATEQQIKSQRDKKLFSGFATAQEIDTPPTELESFNTTSQQTNFVPANQELFKATLLPGNFKLSPNFTLEMLSSKAPASPGQFLRTFTAGGRTYTYGELAFNLQAVALNICEPVFKIYPDMFVTSGYRNYNTGDDSRLSQHLKGQAVDIQFKGLPKSKYFERAKELAKVLKYDQFLLEYKTEGTGMPWIHISYVDPAAKATNRSQILTFFNHKTKGPGLINLA